jgi:hypothetical protein
MRETGRLAFVKRPFLILDFRISIIDDLLLNFLLPEVLEGNGFWILGCLNG